MSSNAWAKSKGYCATCRSKRSRPVPGKMNCQRCLDNAKRNVAYSRLVAAQDGLCTTCLKLEARNGYKTCEVCAQKRRKRAQQDVRLEAAE